jgi:hypothetical protein
LLSVKTPLDVTTGELGDSITTKVDRRMDSGRYLLHNAANARRILGIPQNHLYQQPRFATMKKPPSSPVYNVKVDSPKGSQAHFLLHTSLIVNIATEPFTRLKPNFISHEMNQIPFMIR